MREIKFRVWDKRETKGMYTKEMLYDAESHTYWRDFLNYPHAYVLTQFTGLLDKNGKEVYEGDVVKVSWTRGTPSDEGKFFFVDETKRIPEEQICSIVFENGKFEFKPHCRLHYLTHVSKNCEIIGNIFENPELLK